MVAHPLLPPYVAASARRLAELADGDRRCRPDALETMNPAAAWVPGWRRRVERLACSLRLCRRPRVVRQRRALSWARTDLLPW